MKDTKVYLLILKKLIVKKIVKDSELTENVDSKTKSILTRRIKFLRYFGFNILSIKIGKNKYYYIK